MLGEHVEILSGYAFKSKKFNDRGLGVPVVRIRDVGKEKSETFYDGEYSGDYLIGNGDLLIGMDGDFRLAEWKGGKALLNQRVCKITSKDSSLDRVYMYYMLPRELKRIEDKTPFATVKHLSVKKIKNIEIPLPPLDQQKKIAAILDKADAYRQKTKALIEKYDELTQSLFFDMFGDPQSCRGNEVLGDYCKFYMGGTPAADVLEYYEGGDINWLKGGDIAKEYIYEAENKITELGFKSCNTKTYKDGTIVIGRTGQGKTRGKVGILMKPMCTNETMIAIVSEGKLNPYYLMHNLKYRYKELRSLGGDNQRGGITQTQLKIFKVLVPELDLQNQFAERVQAIEAQKEQVQASLAQAEDLFNSLLQKAFKGELTS